MLHLLPLLALLAPPQTSPQFDVIELPRTEGFQTHVFDMNEAGQSVGYMLDDAFRWRALQWDAEGSVTELGDPGEWSIAYGISQLGIAAGIQGPTVQQTSPHGWFQGAEASVPVPPGTSGAELRDVNDQLLSVGFAFPTIDEAAYAWVFAQTFQLAPPQSFAFEVNNQPAAVGRRLVSGFPRAVHWGAAGQTLLDDRDGDASGLSPSGRIAGSLLFADFKFHAVTWPASDEPAVDLGLFQDENPTAANDVNDNGTVVGNFTVLPVQDETRALLWQPDGTVVDLNATLPPDSPWTLEDARSIDNSGRIVGVGTRSDLDGGQRAFLLKPLEPGS